jgi:hypothetical protein
MQHLHAGEQSFVYRRGSTVVAINNDTAAVELRVASLARVTDALGICADARRSAAAFVIALPPRSACVF